MAPDIISSKTSLGYPLYAADFDYDGRLLVGGGGGPSKTGVGNKLTLLNVSLDPRITVASEVCPSSSSWRSVAPILTPLSGRPSSPKTKIM